MYTTLLIIGLIIILGYMLLAKTEMFSDTEIFSDIPHILVGYNNSVVMDYSIDPAYEIQNKNFEMLLEAANKTNPELPTSDSDEILWNSNITFPLESEFKAAIKDYLIKHKILNNDISFSSGILKMYVKNAPLNSKIYSFNITVNDKEFSRPISVKITVDGSTQEIKINSIVLEQSISNESIDSIDELNPNYYEIYNKYHLMDPFLTSGKKMIITDLMKTNFNKIVEQKKTQKDTEYHSYV